MRGKIPKLLTSDCKQPKGFVLKENLIRGSYKSSQVLCTIQSYSFYSQWTQPCFFSFSHSFTRLERSQYITRHNCQSPVLQSKLPSAGEPSFSSSCKKNIFNYFSRIIADIHLGIWTSPVQRHRLHLRERRVVPTAHSWQSWRRSFIAWYPITYLGRRPITKPCTPYASSLAESHPLQPCPEHTPEHSVGIFYHISARGRPEKSSGGLRVRAFFFLGRNRDLE